MTEMNKAIYFDMDGTIANLYAIDGWLPMLRNSDSTPYKEAKPMVRMNVLARRLNKLQKDGYTIGIISWLAKDGNKEYNEKVTNAKREWLNKHLKSVNWNEVHIVEYGTPKHNIVRYPNGILFDDEDRNRNEWTGTAYDEKEILNVLKAIN